MGGIHPRRWIADPITETLIRRFTAAGALPLQKDWRPSSGFRREISAYLPTRNAPGTTPAGLLARAARGFLLRCFPPDISSIALGDFDNACLPPLAWSRLVTGSLPIPNDAPTLKATPHTHVAVKRESPPSFVSSTLDAFKKAIAWNPDRLRQEGILADTDDESDQKKKYWEHVRRRAEEARRTIENHYIANGTDGTACFSLAVLQFAKDLTVYGGPVKIANLAPATIDSYVADVLDGLIPLRLSNLRTVPTDERQKAYGDAISQASSGNRTGVVVALRMFEATLLRDFDVEDEVDWSALPVHLDVAIRVDANVVDPATYAALWTILKTVRCTHEELRLLWQTLTLLLYRFGLRRGEAHELTLADIRFGPGHEVRVIIHESRMTTHKSRQALREVGPVILPEDEWQLLKSLMGQRQREVAHRARLDDVYLFGRPHYGSHLVDADSLFRPITELLHWITGDKSLRIHHFRHAFATRLFMSGRSPMQALDELTNRTRLWQECFQKDGAWLRAYELGHVSPLEAVTTYCHTAELAHYHFACVATAQLVPPDLLDHLVDLAQRSFERALQREAKANTENPRGIVELLLQRVRSKWPLDTAAAPGVSPEQLLEAADAPTQIAYIPPTSAGYSSKEIRFRDLLEIMRDYLTHRLDLSFWERRGIQGALIREWIARIDHLSGLGLIRSDRKRRDRMPDALIECGQRALDALNEHPIADPEATLARCLVGFGNAVSGNRVDPKTGAELKTWLEFRNPSMQVETECSSKGDCRIKLVVGSPISHVTTQLFLTVLGVRLLTKEAIDSKIAPYRRLRHDSPEESDPDGA